MGFRFYLCSVGGGFGRFRVLGIVEGVIVLVRWGNVCYIFFRCVGGRVEGVCVVIVKGEFVDYVIVS